MHQGLKNTGTTYQRFVNKIFVDLIDKTREVYVHEMLVKSLTIKDNVKIYGSFFPNSGGIWIS